MKFKICLNSREMQLVHDCISFAFNEGTLLNDYSSSEFANLMLTISDLDPIDFNEAINFVKNLIGENATEFLTKEAIIKIYDMSRL